ncbi:MAG: MMPL family transporter [Burkholderiales bacterium]
MSARIAAWLLLSGLCAGLAWHAPLTFDLTAFLPRASTPSQKLLVEQLKSGATSRLMLIAVSGEDTRALAQVSHGMAQALRESGFFSMVGNGDMQSLAAAREFLLHHRYVLSPAVSAQHFSAPSLRAALQNDLELLGSPAGALIKPVLARDPTGELLRLLTPAGDMPAARHGVWFSRDGKKALLIAETQAPGFDAEAQNRALANVKQAFAASRPSADMQLLLTGPGVFAAQSRAIIERDSWRLSLMAALLVCAILFSVYRSARVLALGLLPVASGLLAGIAAVSLVFGTLHGITLGFAATLIGEAVDYPSYLFTQVAKSETAEAAMRRIWPTLRLAVLTTVFGSLTMLFSSFTGLSQLGLLSMTGVLAAGAVTRWILPALAPRNFSPRTIKLAAWLEVIQAARVAGKLAAAVLLIALIIIAARWQTLWDDDVANLNPIPEAAKQLDQELRKELGAPDVRYLVVITGAQREEVLQASEQIAPKLQALAQKKIITGFEGAFQTLPSEKTQLERRAALPENTVLQKNLSEALRDLPFRADLFEPFLQDVEAARSGALLQESDLPGTPFALKLRAQLFQNAKLWVALLLLRGVDDPDALAQNFTGGANPNVYLLDLKTESGRLINGYRNEALRLTALGMLAITLVLMWGLRKPSQVWQVLRPVLAALVITVAALLLLGERFNLFHLVSLLLVLGIGLNYSLFFRVGDTAARKSTYLSLLVCSLTTLSGFGCLAFSLTPVLHAIGLTVSLGCVFSLLVAAAWARR